MTDFFKLKEKYDMLLSLVAVDLGEGKFKLVYELYSTETNEIKLVDIKCNGKTKSVIEIYPSAYFDECEIYDMFGIKFDGNSDLKRLLMPASWQGHPLKKDYKQTDERLAWNE